MAELIKDLLPYTPLVRSIKTHADYEKTLEPKKNYTFCTNTDLLGLEVEVEGCLNPMQVPYYWKFKPDGSLRNYGQEAISIPLQARQVPYALHVLTEALMFHNPKFDFSPRTSVHVHLNVRDLTWDEVKTLLLLYSIFERHFFSLAGTRREQSIFCVPLYLSHQLQTYPHVEYACESWSKYSALNLGTITGNNDVARYGTIEFRHLFGTIDHEILFPWIESILCLKVAAKKFDRQLLEEKIKTLNTTSEYIALYQQVFGKVARLDLLVKRDFEHCVTQTKIALCGRDMYNKYTTNSTLFDNLGKVDQIPF